MTDKPAAPEPVAWLIRWTERDTPCSMLVDHDPGPAAEDKTITPLYLAPPESKRIALLEGLLKEATGALMGDFEINPHDVLERIRAALGE